jgi:hypothetical protein
MYIRIGLKLVVLGLGNQLILDRMQLVRNEVVIDRHILFHKTNKKVE